MKESVSALIPAYNEEDTLEATILALKSIKLIDEIVVIDDGSTDRTYQIAKKSATKVIKSTDNKGKGAALNNGLTQVNGDIILLVDADLSDTAVQIEKLLKPILNDGVDMTIAKFPIQKRKSGIGLAKSFARWGLKKLTSQEFCEPLSGQRAITKEVVDRVGSFADGFGVEVALTIDACYAGFKVREILVEMKHRKTGKNLRGFIHRGKQFKDILKVFIAKRSR